MWLQMFIPPPIFFFKMDSLNVLDESFFHSLIWAMHLNLMGYKHGQKDHH
jgi:hypothetical protein